MSDLTDSQAVAVSTCGPVQVLVNNAGTNRPKPFDEASKDDVDALPALNVKAAFLLARAGASALNAVGLLGSIVQMSSQMVHVGGAHRIICCSTKHALDGMSKALALELGPHRIHVNTVRPTA